MGGRSVFTGASFQASAAAAVMAHMIAESRLNWLELQDDRPQTLSGETGGTGDDLRVMLCDGLPVIEVQAKRSLSGPKALLETLTEIAARSAGAKTTEEIVLLVGGGSSPEVADTFASDVIRFRQGRSDLRHITRGILEKLDSADVLLRRLRVIALDFESLGSSGTQAAIANLRLVLENREDAESAWDTLVAEGVRICKGGQITRTAVATLLRSRQFALGPVGPDARWELRLDHIRDLFKQDRPRTAKGVVEELEKELRGKAVGPRVRARLNNSLGVAFHQNHQPLVAIKYFERALEYLPPPAAGASARDEEPGVNWSDTTTNLASTFLSSDQSESAAATIEPVLLIRPARPNAWALAAQLEFSGHLEPISIPSEIADTPELREAQVAVAMQQEEWDKAADIATKLVSEGRRGGQLFALRATAFANAVLLARNPSDHAARLLSADRAGSAAIERLEDTELDNHLVDSLVARAAILEAMGKNSDASADYARVEAIAPFNPNLLRRKVNVLEESGDYAGGLALLSDEVVRGSPILLVLRAHVSIGAEQHLAARRDLEAALDHLEPKTDRSSLSICLNIAELTTRIAAPDLAEKALRRASDSGSESFRAVLEGRIAFDRANTEQGVAAYRRAEKTATTKSERTDILLELASAFYAAKDFAASVAVYEEVGSGHYHHRGFHSYLRALMRAESYEKVLSLIEGSETEGEGGIASLPHWALRMAVDIAWRQEDYFKVIHYVQPLADEEQDIESQLLLASAYLSIRREDSALPLLSKLAGRDDLTPEERMQLANLFQATKAKANAASQAFKALRYKPDDKRMIMNFVIVLATESDVPADNASLDHRGHGDVNEAQEAEGLTAVTPDSWVRLVPDRAAPIEYFIYASPPVEAGKNEYLVSDAVVQDTVGKKRGDVIIRNPGRWNERHYRVDEILPAIVQVFRRHITEFEGRFPDTPFIQQYDVGEKPTLETLAPLLATLRASSDYSDRIWGEYDAKRLPICLVAVALKRPLGQTIGAIASAPNRYVFTDPPHTAEFAESVRIAQESSRLVITRQSFATMLTIGRLDRILADHEVLVPASLLEELHAEIDEYSTLVEKGRIGMFETDGGFGISEIKPGEAAPWLLKLQNASANLESRGTVLRRPLSALKARDQEWRENLLGSSSFDAVAIARAESTPLFADDWGLRSVAKAEFGVQSFSTAAFSTALLERGEVSNQDHEEDTIQLILLKHYFIPIRPQTVLTAFRKDRRTAQSVISRLADPELDVSSSVGVAVAALRAIGLTPIVSVSLREATVLLLRALLADKSGHDVIPLFLLLAREAFKLMPQQLHDVHEATMGIVRALGYVPRIGEQRH